MQLQPTRLTQSRSRGRYWIALLCGLLLGLLVVLPAFAVVPAGNITTSTNEDTAVSINVSNPSPALHNLLLITPSPAHGTAVVQGDKTTIIYTPGANQTSSVTFGYHFCEISSNTCGSPGQITVNITAVNDDPVAVDDTHTVNEDALLFGVTINVLGNDSPGPNETEPLRVVNIVTPPTNGTATFLPINSAPVTYIPSPNFCGVDTFEYQVWDGALTDIGLVTVTVTCINDPPTATNDTFTVNEDSVNNVLNVLANDNGGPANENQTLTIVPGSVTAPTHGTAVINGANIQYTPAANVCTPATFNYTIQDDGGTPRTATVIVNVTCLPEVPTLTVVNPQNLGNHTFSVDVLLDSPDTAVSALDFMLGFNTSCLEDRDTPANGFAGAGDDDITTTLPTTNPVPPNFSFLAQDVAGQIRFLVASTTNPASILAGPSGPTNRTIATIRFRLKPTCPQPTTGQFAVGFAFPSASFFGTNSQQIAGGITVPVNTMALTANLAPTAIGLTPATVQEGIAGATAGTLSTTDADDTTHTYTLVSGTGSTDNSSFQILGNQLKLQPALIANFATKPSYSVRVRSTDPYGGSTEIVFTITVIRANRAPNAVNDGVAPPIIVTHGTSLLINVLANDSDPDGNPLTIIGVTQGAKGAVGIAGSNVTYNSSDPDYNGTDSFSYTISDGQAPPLTDSATVSVIVVANDTPGDCNSDSAVNAGDLAALGLEIFDNDGQTWYNAFQSTFVGSPRGCDANGDQKIDAADIVTTVCIIFTSNACPPAVTASDAQSATLAVGSGLSAAPGAKVSVPVRLTTGGNSVVAAVFAVDFDTAHLSFDATDADNSGLPDAVSINAPADMSMSATYNAAESRIEIVVFDLPPFTALSDGTLATVDLTVNAGVTVTETAVNLTTTSLGNTEGQSVPVEVTNGAVEIKAQPGGQNAFRIFLPNVIR